MTCARGWSLGALTRTALRPTRFSPSLQSTTSSTNRSISSFIIEEYGVYEVEAKLIKRLGELSGDLLYQFQIWEQDA